MADKKISELEEKSLADVKSEYGLIVAAIRNKINYAVNTSELAGQSDITNIYNTINELPDRLSKDFNIDGIKSDIDNLNALSAKISHLENNIDLFDKIISDWDTKADKSELATKVGWDAFDTKANKTDLDYKVNTNDFNKTVDELNNNINTKADWSALDLKADKVNVDILEDKFNKLPADLFNIDRHFDELDATTNNIKKVLNSKVDFFTYNTNINKLSADLNATKTELKAAIEPSADGLWLRYRTTTDGTINYSWVKMEITDNGTLKISNS